MTDISVHGSFSSINTTPKPFKTHKSGGQDLASLAPDGGWGWVVVLASFMLSVLLGLHLTAFSVLYGELVDYFRCDLGLAGWVGSIYIASGNIMSVYFSVLVDMYGCRKVGILGGLFYFTGLFTSAFVPNIELMMLTYGIMAGIGYSMCLLASVVIIQQYFNKKRAIAASIAAAGNSLGVLLSGPICRALIDAYTWKGCLTILSAITLNALVFAAIFRPLNSPNQWKVNNNDLIVAGHEVEKETQDSLLPSCRSLASECGTKMCDWSVCTIPVYVISFGAFIPVCLAYMPFYSHSITRSIYHNLDPHTVAWIPTAMGLATLTARFSFGWVANLTCVNLMVQSGVGIMTAGLVQLLYTFCTNLPTIMAACVAYGFASGCFLTVQPPMLVDMVGVEKYSRAQAIIFMLFGFSSLISIPAAGYVVDVTGDYNLPFYVAGSIEILGGVVICLLPLVHKRTQEVRNLQG